MENVANAPLISWYCSVKMLKLAIITVQCNLVKAKKSHVFVNFLISTFMMYSENFMVLFDHLVQATISFYEIQEVHDGITPKSFAINTTIFSFYTSIDKKSASCSFFFGGGFFCCVGGGWQYLVSWKHIIPLFWQSSCNFLLLTARWKHN